MSGHRSPTGSPVKTIGLVGGLGPLATIDYYRRLLAGWSTRFPGTAPHAVIDSLDAAHVLRLAAADRPALVRYVLASVQRLQAAGSDVVAITSATTHLVYDEVAAQASVPLINIVECCAAEASRRRLHRLLLLGARFTMEASFFPERFSRHGMEIVVPPEADRVWFHDRYVNQLLKGDFRDETRAEFAELVRRLHAVHGFDAVILGGTELPLLLREETLAEWPVLDATALHVAEILRTLAA